MAGSRRVNASRCLTAPFAAGLLLLSGCSGFLEGLTDDGEEVPHRSGTMVAGLPAQWFGGGPLGQFEIGTDQGVSRGGRNSAYILTNTTKVFGDQFAALTQQVRADA